MNRLINIIVLLSACYVVSAWKDWKEGKTRCEICLVETGAYLTDFKLARAQQIPKLTETCNKYETPEGSCDSYMKMFEFVYDNIEKRLDAQKLCDFYGSCETGLDIDTDDLDIPAAPVTPKNPSKVYDDSTCNKCNITATTTYYNVGAYAVSLQSGLVNNCLSNMGAIPVPTASDTRYCSAVINTLLGDLTSVIKDKSNVDYLCEDLFDMCK